MGLRAVFFDVGETLVDETRIWASYADWFGVPHLTFFAYLGGLIERGRPHLEAFEHFKPGFDLEAEREARRRAGVITTIEAGDLYPDAAPCLARMKQEGYVVGVGGNQPVRVEEQVRDLGLQADVVASSARLGPEKPDPDFFVRLAELAGVRPEEAAYVGDRVDNDVLPALEVGMTAVFLTRGPWGHLHASWPEASRAHLRIASLAELPGRLTPLV